MEDEIASLKGLEAVLGNALENARGLRVQSKRFVEILKDDESSLHYTGHGYRIGAPIEDGVISLEESTVTQLVESCNHAAETAREIEDITSEIDELLGSMEYVHIDISDQTEKIRKDCKKVERLEEYGRSYRRYAEEFIELDRYLCKALEPYQSEENKGLTEMDLIRYNYYANSPGKREKTAEGEALPVIAGGVTAALLGVEPFIDGMTTPSGDCEEDVQETEKSPQSEYFVVTLEQLESLGFDVTKDDTKYLCQYMYDAGITNEYSITMFIATMLVESQWGTKTIETLNADGTVVGDGYGPDDRGAGYIQLTGEEMQRAFLMSVGDESMTAYKKENGEYYEPHETAIYIAEHYPARASVYYFAEVPKSGLKPLNQYVVSRMEDIDAGRDEMVFLIVQYYTNSWVAGSNDDLMKLRTGQYTAEFDFEKEIIIDNQVYNVLRIKETGQEYRLPLHYEERQEAYYRVKECLGL